MMNKVFLIGRLGAEVDIRYMTSGEAVANVSLATSENWKDKNGEKQERTEWHHLVFYRRLAEIVGEYCHKGDLLHIEGKIQTRKWQDKETGKDRYTTEIIVSEMKMLSVKRNEEHGSAQPQSKPSPTASPASKPAGKSSFDNFDDDIPF